MYIHSEDNDASTVRSESSDILNAAVTILLDFHWMLVLLSLSGFKARQS